MEQESKRGAEMSREREIPSFMEREFDKTYKAVTKEDAVRYAKQARNAGFKTAFKMTGDPEWPYGFVLVDPFEGMEYPEDWA